MQTTGSATVASVGPPFDSNLQPATYFTDASRAPFVDENLFATFAPYDTATAIPRSETDSFIALQFSLSDGVHFGFARLAGPTLFDFAMKPLPGWAFRLVRDRSPLRHPCPCPLASR